MTRPQPTRRQMTGLLAAVEYARARWATIVYQPGPGNAERTVSRRRRAGSRRTKHMARRR